MSLATRTVRMPAIYGFDFPEFPEQSAWGWHKATELYEAVTNLMVQKGMGAMDPLEIGEKYSHLSPMNDRDGRGHRRDFHLISSEGKPWLFGCGTAEWLKHAVEDDCYIPAKLGTQLIAAVKNPLCNAVRKFAAA